MTRGRTLLSGLGWLVVVVAPLLSAGCRVSPSHRCNTTNDCVSGVCVSGLCRPPFANDAAMMEVSVPGSAIDAGHEVSAPDGAADGGPPDVPADGPPDAPDAGELDGGDGGDGPDDGGGDASPAIDITWATWPMPNPPFQGFETRDPTGLPNLQSYDYSSDPAVVVDLVTGLVWQRDATDVTFDQPQAREQCAGLTLDGHDDWRLPSRIELTSIIDYTANRTPLVDLSAFPTAVKATYWSGSPTANPTVYWTVTFGTPASSTAAVNNNVFYTAMNLVRCVRRPTPQGPLPPHYDFSEPGTVRDNWTTLTWQRTAAPDLMNGYDALSYCGAVAPAGAWRLPSVKELLTLVPEHTFTSFDPDVFSEPAGIPNDASHARFWTSSWSDNNPTDSYLVEDGGEIGNAPMADTQIRARCVR